jgi:hypothetical protein
VDATRDEGLQRLDDLAGDRDRVDRVVRHRRVPPLAGNVDGEDVGRGEHGSRPRGDPARRQERRDVDRECGVDGRLPLEQTLLDHGARAEVPLLARLEHEADVPCEALTPLAQEPRGARQHGRVRVVAAGVHRPLAL